MTIARLITGHFYCPDCVDQDGGLAQAEVEQDVKPDTPVTFLLPTFWYGCGRCGCDLAKEYVGYPAYDHRAAMADQEWARREEKMAR